MSRDPTSSLKRLRSLKLEPRQQFEIKVASLVIAPTAADVIETVATVVKERVQLIVSNQQMMEDLRYRLGNLRSFLDDIVGASTGPFKITVETDAAAEPPTYNWLTALAVLFFRASSLEEDLKKAHDQLANAQNVLMRQSLIDLMALKKDTTNDDTAFIHAVNNVLDTILLINNLIFDNSAYYNSCLC